MRLIRSQRIDLVIAAKNDDRLKSVIRASKLSRKSPVSTLIVPNGSTSAISRILVAVDGSESSMKAAKAGIYLADTMELNQLALARVFNVPYNYLKTGHGVQSNHFFNWTLEIIENSMKSMVSRLDSNGLEIKIIVRENRDVTDGVRIILDRINGDLLVISAKGKSFIPSYSLGSTAEEIIFSSRVPILVVK